MEHFKLKNNMHTSYLLNESFVRCWCRCKYVYCNLCYLNYISRWHDLAKLSNGLCDTSAVLIPGHGILLVGDRTRELGRRTQMLQGNLEMEPSLLNWYSWPQMLTARKRPGIAFYEGCVYVAGGNLEEYSDIEMLHILPKSRVQSQWTIVELLKFPLKEPCNLFVFDDDLRILRMFCRFNAFLNQHFCTKLNFFISTLSLFVV